MTSLSRRTFLAAGVTVAAAPTFGQSLNTPNIDDFFRDFTADWVRHDPNQATSARYFSGDEQDRLERELTPQTLAWKRDRIQRARHGVAGLRKFDNGPLTETQRVSAEVMEWQLNEVVREEPFLDYSFPLQQMSGVNVGLVETITV